MTLMSQVVSRDKKQRPIAAARSAGEEVLRLDDDGSGDWLPCGQLASFALQNSGGQS